MFKYLFIFFVLFFQTQTGDASSIKFSAVSLFKKKDRLAVPLHVDVVAPRAEHSIAILINIDHELEKIIQVIKTNSDEKTLEEAKFRLRILYRKHSEHHALQAIIYPYNALFVLKLDLPPCIDGDKVQQETKARVIPITVVQKVESDKSKVFITTPNQKNDHQVIGQGSNSVESSKKPPVKPTAPWGVLSVSEIENGYQEREQGSYSEDSLSERSPVKPIPSEVFDQYCKDNFQNDSDLIIPVVSPVKGYSNCVVA